ncbi:hypothetical protein MNAN1_000776 [Malassezia nana]|uniref:Uncharacterized protein n=1 Tax=Malassezia nana TaxID=180528 RepID=A0AAF0J693_9BASI|nr:hypothetical protein MNAN1_000776 [Malassezia nana]
MSARPGWRLALPRLFGRYASTKSKPPKSVINFRNMQRRRGGKFRTDIRVERHPKKAAALHPDTLRQHMFATSQRINSIAKQESDALARFKKSESLLMERMADWRLLARRVRFQQQRRTPITPQHGAPAWNHVILLAVRAACHTAAWHLFCDMKRQGIRPTARTYAGFFQALAQQARTGLQDTFLLPSWTERFSKLYEGLEQLHTEAAAHDTSHDALSPHQVAHQRVLLELDKDPTSVATAFRHYLSLLCALGRSEEALEMFDQLCHHGYPVADEHPRLPREQFATVQMYTSLLRDVGLCRMPMAKKQNLVREIWRRWQDDIDMALRRGAASLLDATAVKTLVWTLDMGQPHASVREVCHMLGTYMAVPFRSLSDQDVHPVSCPLVPWSDDMLLDVLAFFNRHGAYNEMMDCYDHAQKAAPQSWNPSTVALYQKARTQSLRAST